MRALSPTSAWTCAAGPVTWSAVVETRIVQAENRALPLAAGPGERLRSHVVHLGGRPHPLGKIASSIVHLQEVPAAPPGGRSATVPRVRDEEGDVARPPDEENGRAAVIGQGRVALPIGRGEPARSI